MHLRSGGVAHQISVRHIGTAMMHLAAVTSFVIWAFAIHPILAKEEVGCPYLSNAEVERVTERKLLFELKSMPLPHNAGVLCDSEIARVIILSGNSSEARWEDMLRGFGRENDERMPVTGLGDKAYAIHLEPRKENEYPTALVVVLSRSYTAAVSVRAKEGERAESVRAQAIALAKIAISRVP